MGHSFPVKGMGGLACVRGRGEGEPEAVVRSHMRGAWVLLAVWGEMGRLGG